MTTIGYIRVGSSKQTLELQRFEIENFALKERLNQPVFTLLHFSLSK